MLLFAARRVDEAAAVGNQMLELVHSVGTEVRMAPHYILSSLLSIRDIAFERPTASLLFRRYVAALGQFGNVHRLASTAREDAMRMITNGPLTEVAPLPNIATHQSVSFQLEPTSSGKARCAVAPSITFPIASETSMPPSPAPLALSPSPFSADEQFQVPSPAFPAAFSDWVNWSPGPNDEENPFS